MRRHILKDIGENRNFDQDQIEAALSDNREDNSAAVDTDSDKSLYRDRKTGKRQVSHTAQGNSQRSDIQEYYKSIKDAIQRVKIPPELKVDDSRKCVKRQEQGKAAIISACAGYGETLLKLLLTLEPEKPLKEGDLDDLLTIISAQLRYLQEERALVLVNSSLGEGVGRLYRNFRDNTSMFPPSTIDTLQSLVTLYNASNPNTQSNRGHGRGSYRGQDYRRFDRNYSRGFRGGASQFYSRVGQRQDTHDNHNADVTD